MSEHIETGPQRTRHIRRSIGALAGCSPLFLLAASIVEAVTRGDEGHAIGRAVMFGALVIGGVNEPATERRARRAASK